MARPPHPYLSVAEVDERARTLGFIIGPEVLDYPPGFQKLKMQALEQIMAGFLAEWLDLELEEGDTWTRLNQELTEAARQYLTRRFDHSDAATS